MKENVFRRLQEHLDDFSIGFPATESGIEIEMLKEMFSEEEAAMFTVLTAELETPESVARRIKKPVEEVARQLENMAKKGLLFRRREGQSVEYSAIPFIHGLLEFQIDRADKDVKKIVQMAGKYINEKLKHSMAESVDLFMRTIPVHRSVAAARHVAPYEDAHEILRNEELIVVTDCACRKQKSLFDKDCGKPLEVCFMFGPMGKYYLENGLGRQVGLDEAFKILDRAHDAGLITQTATAQEPFTMCNCCVCCCGFLRAASKYPNPAELVFSNYIVTVDQSKCTGCEKCVECCGMNAIKMSDDGVAQIDLNRCIGCGQCVTSCPENARQLVLKAEGKYREPPADTVEQMKLLARKRGMEDTDPSRIVSYGF